MSNTIIYEQPLNERIRTFLRLEHLFARVDLALQGNSELHNRDTIEGLLNILAVFERSDLKAEVIKELERLVTTLSALKNTPGVDRQALDYLLIELDQRLDVLHLKKSAIGDTLRDNEFLYTIRQRSSIPGGACEFDLPAYHFWLHHTSPEERKQQLTIWLDQFSIARAAIDISLKLIRDSTDFTKHTADTGFYQHSLDNNQPYQLIRVRTPKDASFFPEISGGKHRFTVRFMQFDIEQRPQQVSEDIEFSLSSCVM